MLRIEGIFGRPERGAVGLIGVAVATAALAARSITRIDPAAILKAESVRWNHSRPASRSPLSRRFTKPAQALGMADTDSVVSAAIR